MNLPLPFCANNCGKRCATKKRKYCSIRCQFDHDFSLRCKLIELGQYPSSSNPRMLKKYLIARFGEKCSQWGWAEKHPRTGKVPIELEHIDGDPSNNSLANITLLCPNCHALTPFFRGLNRGRGRATRLGGRQNPLRGGAPKGKRLVEPSAPFPLPRSLVALVEAKDPALDVIAGVP
jgi:hypothetical protein